MRYSAWAVTLMAMTACGGGPAALEPSADVEDANGVAPRALDLTDPAGGMTLRLPRPGASRAEVMVREPACREDLEPDGDRCRFHGWIRPLSQPCEDGCTWWTYQLEGDRLSVAELERSVWDVSSAGAAHFADEARRVANELSRRLGVPPQIDELARWESVESISDGTLVLLERRTWALDDLLVTWTLSGHAGHHPGAILHVRVEDAHPEQLVVEMLHPELVTGAPLLRLRGGPVPRPLDVPLWLTFDERDHDYESCSVRHEAVAFPLPDGRIYVGQYNALCGGARQCRIVDPRTGAAEQPPGGCLWGEGVHHRATAVGDGHVLLISDAEGAGAVEVVRYDPARGAEVRLHLPMSATARIGAEVSEGGVDISTVCEVPPGCEPREYGEVPSREYRWTPAHGLVAR